jgi:hypothetical protein
MYLPVAKRPILGGFFGWYGVKPTPTVDFESTESRRQFTTRIQNSLSSAGADFVFTDSKAVTFVGRWDIDIAVSPPSVDWEMSFLRVLPDTQARVWIRLLVGGGFSFGLNSTFESVVRSNGSYDVCLSMSPEGTLLFINRELVLEDTGISAPINEIRTQLQADTSNPASWNLYCYPGLALPLYVGDGEVVPVIDDLFLKAGADAPLPMLQHEAADIEFLLSEQVASQQEFSVTSTTSAGFSDVATVSGDINLEAFSDLLLTTGPFTSPTSLDAWTSSTAYSVGDYIKGVIPAIEKSGLSTRQPSVGYSQGDLKLSETKPGRRVKITLDTDSLYTGSVTDFPRVVTKTRLPSEMFDADGLYPALPDGGDLWASLDGTDATRVPLDLIFFSTDNNPVNGTAELWVRLPSDETDEIWIHWGGEQETQPARNTTYGGNSVWSNNFGCVWRLWEDPQVVSSVLDRTGQGHTGTFATGGVFDQADQSGMLNPCWQCYNGDGLRFTPFLSSVYGTSTISMQLESSNDVNVGLWGEGSGPPAYWAIFTNGGGSGVIRTDLVDGSGAHLIAQTGGVLPSDTPFVFSAARNGNNGSDMFLSIDGSDETSSTSGTGATTTFSPDSVGYAINNLQGFASIITVSTVARNSTWLTAWALMLNNPTSGLSTGSPEDGQTFVDTNPPQTPILDTESAQAQNLVALYPAVGNNWSPLTDLVGSKNLTLGGSITTVSDEWGNVPRLANAYWYGSHSSVGTLGGGSPGCTLTAWIKLPSSLFPVPGGSATTIMSVGRSGSWELAIEANYEAKPRMYAYGPSFGEATWESSTSMSFDVWTHVALRYTANGAAMQFLLNGTQIGDYFTITPNVEANVIAIGTGARSGGREGYMILGEARVYTAPLSDGQINVLVAEATRWGVYYIPQAIPKSRILLAVNSGTTDETALTITKTGSIVIDGSVKWLVLPTNREFAIQYVAVKDGTSHTSEPVWGAETVTDNDIEWQAVYELTYATLEINKSEVTEFNASETVSTKMIIGESVTTTLALQRDSSTSADINVDSVNDIMFAIESAARIGEDGITPVIFGNLATGTTGEFVDGGASTDITFGDAAAANLLVSKLVGNNISFDSKVYKIFMEMVAQGFNFADYNVNEIVAAFTNVFNLDATAETSFTFVINELQNISFSGSVDVSAIYAGVASNTVSTKHKVTLRIYRKRRGWRAYRLVGTNTGV